MSSDEEWLKLQMMIRPETTPGTPVPGSRFFPRVIDQTVEAFLKRQLEQALPGIPVYSAHEGGPAVSSEPMTAERLAEIGARSLSLSLTHFGMDSVDEIKEALVFASDVPDLMAEVGRYHAELAAAQATIARLMEVATGVSSGAVAPLPLGQSSLYWNGPETARILREQARAALEGEAAE